MTKKKAIRYLQEKLHGADTAVKHIIFEAVRKIETEEQNVEDSLEWYHILQDAYDKFNETTGYVNIFIDPETKKIYCSDKPYSNEKEAEKARYTHKLPLGAKKVGCFKIKY